MKIYRFQAHTTKRVYAGFLIGLSFWVLYTFLFWLLLPEGTKKEIYMACNTPALLVFIYFFRIFPYERVEFRIEESYLRVQIIKKAKLWPSQHAIYKWEQLHGFCGLILADFEFKLSLTEPNQEWYLHGTHGQMTEFEELIQKKAPQLFPKS